MRRRRRPRWRRHKACGSRAAWRWQGRGRCAQQHAAGKDGGGRVTRALRVRQGGEGSVSAPNCRALELGCRLPQNKQLLALNYGSVCTSAGHGHASCRARVLPRVAGQPACLRELLEAVHQLTKVGPQAQVAISHSQRACKVGGRLGGGWKRLGDGGLGGGPCAHKTPMTAQRQPPAECPASGRPFAASRRCRTLQLRCTSSRPRGRTCQLGRGQPRPCGRAGAGPRVPQVERAQAALQGVGGVVDQVGAGVVGGAHQAGVLAQAVEERLDAALRAWQAGAEAAGCERRRLGSLAAAQAGAANTWQAAKALKSVLCCPFVSAAALAEHGSCSRCGRRGGAARRPRRG